MASNNPVWRRSSRQARSTLLTALHAHVALILKMAGRVLGNVAETEHLARDIAEKLLPAELRSALVCPLPVRCLVFN